MNVNINSNNIIDNISINYYNNNNNNNNNITNIFNITKNNIKILLM